MRPLSLVTHRSLNRVGHIAHLRRPLHFLSKPDRALRMVGFISSIDLINLPLRLVVAKRLTPDKAMK